MIYQLGICQFLNYHLPLSLEGRWVFSAWPSLFQSFLQFYYDQIINIFPGIKYLAVTLHHHFNNLTIIPTLIAWSCDPMTCCVIPKVFSLLRICSICYMQANVKTKIIVISWLAHDKWILIQLMSFTHTSTIGAVDKQSPQNPDGLLAS